MAQQSTYTHNPIEELAHLSEELLNIVHEEAKCLEQNDINRFTRIQNDKKHVTERYLHASKAFQDQAPHMNNVDRTALQNLENLQATLNQKTVKNNSLLRHITQKTTANTGSTLFSAQEFAQQNGHASIERIPSPNTQRMR